MKTTDLTPTEQRHIRAALAFLRRRYGTWAATGMLLHFKDTTLGNIAGGHKTPSVTLALRIARAAKVGVDDVLTGRFPSPGTCPMCGHFDGMSSVER